MFADVPCTTLDSGHCHTPWVCIGTRPLWCAANDQRLSSLNLHRAHTLARRRFPCQAGESRATYRVRTLTPGVTEDRNSGHDAYLYHRLYGYCCSLFFYCFVFIFNYRPFRKIFQQQIIIFSIISSLSQSNIQPLNKNIYEPRERT